MCRLIYCPHIFFPFEMNAICVGISIWTLSKSMKSCRRTNFSKWWHFSADLYYLFNFGDERSQKQIFKINIQISMVRSLNIIWQFCRLFGWYFISYILFFNVWVDVKWYRLPKIQMSHILSMFFLNRKWASDYVTLNNIDQKK